MGTWNERWQGEHSWPSPRAHTQVAGKESDQERAEAEGVNHNTKKQPRQFSGKNFIPGLSKYLEHFQVCSK